MCVGTVGCVKNVYARVNFNAGFKEMLRQLEPSQLILYGAMTDPIREQVKDIPHIWIESEQKQRMNRYKEEQ